VAVCSNVGISRGDYRKPWLRSQVAQRSWHGTLVSSFHKGYPEWKAVRGTGAPTLTDMGASYAIATGGVLTLFIAAPPIPDHNAGQKVGSEQRLR
jgi:hypothetical protein